MHMSAWLHILDCLKLSHLYVVFPCFSNDCCCAWGLALEDKIGQSVCLRPFLCTVWIRVSSQPGYCGPLQAHPDDLFGVAVALPLSHCRMSMKIWIQWCQTLHVRQSTCKDVQKGSTPSCYRPEFWNSAYLLHLLCMDAAVEALKRLSQPPWWPGWDRLLWWNMPILASRILKASSRHAHHICANIN